MPQPPRLFVVTGASRGLGRAIVRSLATTHGAHVVAVARDGKAMEAAFSALAGKVELVVGDLLDMDTTLRVAAQVGTRRLHGLVNNAGALHKEPLSQLPANELERLFRVNAIAPLTLTQALLPVLGGEPPGHVVNIGSMGGFQGSSKYPGLAGYSASKAALAALTECMAVEWVQTGVRANCLCLGAVDTEMLREAFPGYTAPLSADGMGGFVARFAVEGHTWFNGRVLPVALSNP